MEELILPIYCIAALFTLVAFFYASVGLGGGSAYTALLTLFGVGVASIPMISLLLNVVVTTLGGGIFLSRKHARFGLIAPFLVSSIPMAYVGGMLNLPKIVFYTVLFISLLLAAIRIYLPVNSRPLEISSRGKLILAFCSGGILGLIAGIAGIGGGVYLVPLILFLGLGSAQEAAACGAFFVWVNSVSGLVSRSMHNSADLMPYFPLLLSVMVGGYAGALIGAGYLKQRTMEKVLGGILIVALVFLGRKISLII